MAELLGREDQRQAANVCLPESRQPIKFPRWRCPQECGRAGAPQDNCIETQFADLEADGGDVASEPAW